MSTSTHGMLVGRPWRALAGLLGAGVLVAALAAPAAAATSRTSAARSTATATATTSAATTACPVAPAQPAVSHAYVLDGQRWNPADPIDWTLDTTGVSAASVPARVADVRRALAAAAVETRFDFVYKGLVTSEPATPAFFSLEFVYTKAITGTYAGSLGEQSNRYVPGTGVRQTVMGRIELLSSLLPGYGGYDAAHPADSAEGDVLLHEVGAVLGLSNVAPVRPDVMNGRASSAHYYSRYQAGDEDGLWHLGAAEGCSAFQL